MISCSDAVKQLWDFLDGSLQSADRQAIEEHLDACRRCCGETEFADELRMFLASHGGEQLPVATRDRLVAFMEQL